MAFDVCGIATTCRGATSGLNPAILDGDNATHSYTYAYITHT